MQVCDFLAIVDANPARDVFRAALFAAARDAPGEPACSVPAHECPPADAQRRSAAAVALLREQPLSVISLVLEAPCAHRDVTSVPLSVVLDVLPTELHAAAARGHYGASAGTWHVNAANPAVCRHVLQLMIAARYARALTLAGSRGDGDSDVVACVGNVTHHTSVALADVRASSLISPLRAFTALESLRALELQDYSLQGCALMDLAPMIACLQALTSLRIHRPAQTAAEDNPTSIPDLLMSRTTESPNTAGAAAFVRQLRPLTRLVELRLVRIWLARDGANALGDLLGVLSHLRHLDVSRNERTSGQGLLNLPADVARICACTWLTSLCLRSTAMSSASMQALGAHLPQLQQLVHLDASVQPFGGAMRRRMDASVLTPGICHLAKLTSLELEHVEWRDPEALGPTVARLPQLQRLITFGGFCAGRFVTLGASITGLASLTRLDLDYVTRNRSDASRIHEGLRRLTQLQHLRVRVRMDGSVAEMVEAVPPLGALVCLTCLHIQGRPLGRTSLHALTCDLSRLSALRKFDLSFSGAEVLQLVPSIAVLSALTSLKLAADKLSGPNAALLTSTLAALPHLRQLDLSQMTLDEDAMHALVSVRSTLMPLSVLWLEFAWLSATSCRDVAEAAFHNLPQLRELHIDRACEDQEGVRAGRALPCVSGLRVLPLDRHNPTWLKMHRSVEC